jgi:hypothetical protein
MCPQFLTKRLTGARSKRPHLPFFLVSEKGWGQMTILVGNAGVLWPGSEEAPISLRRVVVFKAFSHLQAADQHRPEWPQGGGERPPAKVTGAAASKNDLTDEGDQNSNV